MNADEQFWFGGYSSFFHWLEQPRQIVFFSLFFIITCFIITKITKRNRSNHPTDFKVRDPRKSHYWIHSDFLIHPIYCNLCEVSVVRGVFCDTCWLYLHDDCVKEGSKKFACKIMSLPKEKSNCMMHHWVKGNLPLCSKCKHCNLPCGTEPRLCDFRCIWCHITVHEIKCFNEYQSLCNFGNNQEIILPPYCVTLKTAGWAGRKHFVIKDVLEPIYKPWRPILVLINPKSGGNEGRKLLSSFRKILNPAQVIDLMEIPPEIALEFCCLLPGIQARILVCGGDGTIGWVLNTLEKMPHIKKRPQIGIHPMGTGNDLARILGWGVKYVGDEHEIDDVLQDFAKAEAVLFDRWKVTIENTGFFKKKLPPKVLYMNSYVSVGCDAQVVLNFHRHRENQPSLFTSRIINKLMYFIYGSQDVLQAECKNLHERVKLELDGKEVELPPLEGVVILNINSWCGGCQIWDEKELDKMPKFNDGYLEVAGLTSALHIAKLQVNLASPLKLGRAKSVKITIFKTKELKNVPMQLDGEPWEQSPCTVSVTYHNQAIMLQNQCIDAG